MSLEINYISDTRMKKDQYGYYIIIENEKWYMINNDINQEIDNLLEIINKLRSVEKIGGKFDDVELVDIAMKKIAFYSKVLQKIYEEIDE